MSKLIVRDNRGYSNVSKPQIEVSPQDDHVSVVAEGSLAVVLMELSKGEALELADHLTKAAKQIGGGV